ncbi:hypothetical protein EBZ39_11335 [bacterium]|nr:hypothetical protein [bacterium]
MVCFAWFLVLALSASAMAHAQQAPAPEGVIAATPAKKLSRNKLKEELGQAAKDLFNETTDVVDRLGACQLAFASSATVPSAVQRELGGIQRHIAFIQKTCGRLAQELLDDEPRLTKATKVAMDGSLQTLQQTLARCKACTFARVPAVVAKGKATQACTTLAKHEQALRESVERIKADPCLKLT